MPRHCKTCHVRRAMKAKSRCSYCRLYGGWKPHKRPTVAQSVLAYAPAAGGLELRTLHDAAAEEAERRRRVEIYRQQLEDTGGILWGSCPPAESCQLTAEEEAPDADD